MNCAILKSKLVKIAPVISSALFSISRSSYFIILPQVAILLACNGLKTIDKHITSCDSPLISAKASEIITYNILCATIPEFLVLGLYGLIADTYGVRLTLLIPIIGDLIYLLSIMSALYFHTSYYIVFIIVGSLISGMSGSGPTFLMLSFTYAAKISQISERSGLFSLIEFGVFSVRIFVPVLIGYISQKYGFEQALFVGIIPALMNIFWTIFVMSDPEQVVNVPIIEGNLTPTPTGQVEIVISTINTEGLLLSSNFERNNLIYGNIWIFIKNLGRTSTVLLNAFWYQTIGNDTVPYMGAVFYLFFTAGYGESSIAIIYLKHVFKLTSMTLGIFESASNLSGTFSLLVLPILASLTGYCYYRIISNSCCQPSTNNYIISNGEEAEGETKKEIKHFNLSDLRWVELGIISKGLYLFSLCLITDVNQLFLLVFFHMFAGPANPHLKAYLSKSVGNDQQTDIMVTIYSMEALASFTSAFFSLGYKLTVKTFPQCMILLGVFFCFLALSVINVIKYRYGIKNVAANNSETNFQIPLTEPLVQNSSYNNSYKNVEIDNIEDNNHSKSTYNPIAAEEDCGDYRDEEDGVSDCIDINNGSNNNNNSSSNSLSLIDYDVSNYKS